MQKRSKEEKERRVEKKIASTVNKLQKRPQAKRAIKRVNALKTELDWAQRHHLDEYKYALGLFDPKSGICKRIPNPLPIPTAVATQQGMITLTANAGGNLVVALNPWIRGNMILWSNAVGMNDTTALTLTNATPNVSSILSSATASVSRVVSAWIGVADMTPALNKTGIISSGSVSYRQLTSGTATADTIRDSYWVSSVPNVTLSKYVGGVYFPVDPSGTNFMDGSAPTEFEIPVVFLSSITPNASVSIQYCVNFEYVPASGQTDLLSVGVGAIGSIEQALTKVGELKILKKDSGNVSKPGFDPGMISKITTGLGALGGIASTIFGVLSKI